MALELITNMMMIINIIFCNFIYAKLCCLINYSYSNVDVHYLVNVPAENNYSCANITYLVY